VIMTRVWPIAMIQLPTAIYMVSGFENSLRILYLDGRKPHACRRSRAQVRQAFNFGNAARSCRFSSACSPPPSQLFDPINVTDLRASRRC